MIATFCYNGIMSNCETCCKPLVGRQKKFCSRKCKNQNTNFKNQCYQNQQARGLKRKIALIKTKGGKCMKCSYSKNYASLTFHHRNPDEKTFQLDARSCSNRTWDILLEEVAKCDLVCFNCHMEIHHPELEMGRVGIEPTSKVL
jgi:hypothetical protein